MIKLLMGGSPCTKWSIAQSKGRETEAKGIGWELFENYRIAKEKFQPDFFLYENNWSASSEIKEQIQKELGHELMRINSGLLSAQNRDRFYVFNWEVEQPEDRFILLKDILETNVDYVFSGLSIQSEKILSRHMQVANVNPSGKGMNGSVIHVEGKCRCLTTNKGEGQKVIIPCRVGDIPNNKGEISGSQSTRVYGINGKSVNLSANGGGKGAKTGLYAIPAPEHHSYNIPKNCDLVITENSMRCQRRDKKHSSVQGTHVNFEIGKSQTLSVAHVPKVIVPFNDPVYQVINGIITIKNKQYPIKLPDGYYIIRKLTPVECERLQTMPDGYTQYGAVQATEANLKKYNSKIKKGAAWIHKETNKICFEMAAANRYKGLGNGWTKSVIVHILSGALKNIPKDEKIILLSIYDGIGTAYQCLKDMGFTNVECHAYEIDENAMAIAMYNHPDTIQHGDAFQVRESSWNIMK